MYSELVYFEDAHFAHIAAYVEHLRVTGTLAKATAHHTRQRRLVARPSLRPA
jgi:hypothetical protein